MAGFEVTLHGRFWVITEVISLCSAVDVNPVTLKISVAYNGAVAKVRQSGCHALGQSPS
jgi:hypothetical protein